MATFASACCNRWAWRKPAPTIECSWPATSAQKLSDGKDSGYGFGFFIDELYGQPRVGRTGGSLGFTAADEYCPRQNARIIALTNQSSAPEAAEAVTSATFADLFPDVAAAALRPAAGEDPAVTARMARAFGQLQHDNAAADTSSERLVTKLHGPLGAGLAEQFVVLCHNRYRSVGIVTVPRLSKESPVMNFTSFRHWLVAFALAGLAACASAPLVPLAPATVSQALLQPAPDAASKCKIPSFWYFKGSCVAFDITAGPVALAPYKGLSTKVVFPSSNAPPQTPFIVGEGTNRGDITGTYNGKKFPLFGSIPCLNTSGQTVTCPVGADFLYLIVVNASPTTDVQFVSTPGVTVKSATGFPGKKCGSAALEIGSGVDGYVLVPKVTKVVGDTAKFKPLDIPLTIPHANFLVFGFFCS